MQSTTIKNLGASRIPPNRLALAAEQWLFDLPPASRERLETIWETSLGGEGDFAAGFYARLFEAAPQAARLFPGDMKAQGRRLVDTLGEALRLTRKPEQLVLLLRAAGARHHHYRVKQGHFAVMETVLLDTLRARCGARFTDADAEMFGDWFRHAALIMRHAMAGAARG
jgi:nitric oxide dioxygenase